AALSTTHTENRSLNSGALTSLPGAGTWTAAQLFETTNGAAAGASSLAFDAYGNGFGAWIFSGDVYVRRYDAASAQWSAAVRVDTTTVVSSAVQVAVDRATGKAVLGWIQSTGVAVSSYDLATGTWGAVQLMASSDNVTNARDSFALSIAGDFAAVTWVRTESGRLNVRASVANNGVWGAVGLLESTSPHASLPQVGIDATGNALVTWRQSDGTAERVYYSRWSHASQSFSTATLLDGATGATDRPKMGFDGQGNAIAMWSEAGNLYARRFDSATAAWGTIALVQSGTISSWDLSVDAQGNALAGWTQDDGSTISAYARRFDATTGTWGTVALLENSTAAVSGTRISVAIAGNNAVVGWLQTNGTTDDLYAVTSNGGTWSTPQLIDSRSNTVTAQFAAVDMGGSAALVWEQVDGNNFRSIYQASYLSPGYYTVPAGATWQSIANALYGVNSAAAGSALQAAMGNPALTTGALLSAFPATLSFASTVPAYYTVQAGDTWASITQTIYGTSASAAISALQTHLGNPTLATGLELTVPQVLSYASGGASHPLNTGSLTTLPGAGTWTAAQLFETTNGAAAGASSLAFDAYGNGFGAWIFSGDVYVRRYDAATAQWSAAVRVDSGTVTSSAVQVAVDRATGKAVLGWIQSTGVAVSSYDLATGTWGAVQLMASSDNVTNARDSFALSIAGDFTAVTWVRTESGRLNVRASVANNGVWGAVGLLESTSPHASLPQVGIDATGNALVTWRQSDGTAERVYYSRWSHASQSFSTATLLDSGTGATDRPKMGFDGQGNAIAMWSEAGSLYARRFDSATAAWGTTVLVQSGTISSWDLSVDAQGNALAGWTQDDGTTISAYARRFDGASGTWGTVALLESSTAAVSGTRITVAIAGNNAVVGWLQTNGTTDDLYAVTSNGGTWSTPQLIDSRSTTVTAQFAAVDMGGSAALVWEQVDGNNFRSIYQARYISPGYYTVPAGATWQSIANALYGVNSAAAGSALQAAMGNPALTTGALLSGFPASLDIGSTTPSGQIQTDVQDALGLVTRYIHDTSGRLTSVLSPAVNGTRMETRYAYDADGNVTSITEDPTGLNRVTTFGYDANGNLTLTRDSLGNTITRTYDSNNQLLTETTYAGRDTDGAGSGQPTEPSTTRYVYDAESHLRFVVSPEGRVTEHRYDTSGQRTSTRTYLYIRYTATNFAESDLVTWTGSGDRTHELAVYAYDFRGNVLNISQYWGMTTAGAPLGTAMITRFVYDQRGQLLQTIDPRGEATTGNPNDYRTVYTYDGLGRRLTSNEWISATTTRTTLNAYDDAGRTTRSTFANGLVTTSVYNRAGELLSVANGSAGSFEALGKTSYAYDAGGRLRMVTDPTGVRQFFYYDDAGRQVAQVDGDGSLTEFVYNRAGERVKTIQYAALLNSQTRSSLVVGNTPANIALATLRAAAGGNPDSDRISRFVYDASGALVYTIDPSGAVVENRYDGAGRLTDVVQYSNRITISRTVDEVLPSAVAVATHDDDRRTRYFYDGEGLKIGQLDAEGYLTAYVYSGAGRLIEETRYANQSAVGVRATGTLAALKTSVGTDTETAIDSERDQVTEYYYDSMGRLTGVLDAEGYLTETQYDGASNVSKRIRYDQVLSYRSTLSTLKALVVDATVRETTDYTYDGEGKLIGEVVTRGTPTSASSITTTYSYDIAGNLISTTRAAGSDEARTTDVRYDFLGRVIQELSAEGRQRITSG
ncbi:hypothetical protein ACFPN2_34770, partial [Steroidobacter flavus]